MKACRSMHDGATFWDLFKKKNLIFLSVTGGGCCRGKVSIYLVSVYHVMDYNSGEVFY